VRLKTRIGSVNGIFHEGISREKEKKRKKGKHARFDTTIGKKCARFSDKDILPGLAFVRLPPHI